MVRAPCRRSGAMSSAPHASPPSRPGRFDAGVAGVIAFAVLWVLRQHTFYKDDSHVYLLSILEGDRTHPHHMLFKPAVVLAHRVLSPFSLSLYEAALALGAAATAIGIGCALAAARGMGLSRSRAWVVAALVLSVPAVLFFGTVVEVHGFYFAFAGVTFLGTAALARAPTLVRGALLGFAVAVAYMGHASAALLLGLLVPTACFLAPSPSPGRWRRFVAPTLAAAATQLLAMLALPALGRALGLGVDTADAARYVFRDALAFAGEPWRWVATFWYEWLAPYAPLNLLAVLALWTRLRAAAAWLMLAVVPYYLLCVCLLPSAEFGAYLTPFAWPLGLLAVRVAGARVGAGLAIVGFGGGFAWVAAHDRPELARAYALGVLEVAEGKPPFLLLGDHTDAKAFLIALPDAGQLVVLHAGSVSAEQFEAVMGGLERIIRDALADGRTVLLPAGARAMLERVVPSGSKVVPGLAARFRLVPVLARGPGAAFAGDRIDAR